MASPKSASSSELARRFRRSGDGDTNAAGVEGAGGAGGEGGGGGSPISPPRRPEARDELLWPQLQALVAIGRLGSFSSLSFGVALMAVGVVYYLVAGRARQEEPSGDRVTG